MAAKDLTMNAPSRLYPLVVNDKLPPRHRPLAFLGHGLGFALARLRDGGAATYFRDDIEALGGDPVRAYLDARENLGELITAKLVEMRIAGGPRVASLEGRRVPLFVVRHSVLAASCLVAPDLWERAASALGATELAAAIPRHDLLVVFPDWSSEIRAAMQSFVSEHVTLTPELFGLDASGPRELTSFAPTIPIFCDAVGSDGMTGSMQMASGM